MAGDANGDVFRLPGFAGFWAAETVSAFGSAITQLALQVLVVVTLKGAATDVGLVSAARWTPYLLFGLVVGALVDRRPRRPILVATDLARFASLGAIPALWWLGGLTLPALIGFVALFGLMTLLNDAASQSFVPRLVPARALLAANARLDQGAAVAQTTGPMLAGALIGAVGAPLAVLADAVSYLFSALTLATLKVVEPPAASGPAPDLRREVSEGLRWVYRHRMLAPFAVSTHAWFVFNSVAGTVFVPYALVSLRLTPFELGVTFAAAGVAALAGSLVAVRLGAALGAGPAIIGCRVVSGAAWTLVALAPAGGSHLMAVAALAAGQGLHGFSMGASNANEMGYRQAITPDALQGRMNTTMRSINRAVIVAAAPLGGWLGDSFGYRPALWIVAAGFAAGAGALAASPFRHARHGEAAT